MVMILIQFNYIFKEPTSKQLLSEVPGVKISTCDLGVSQRLEHPHCPSTYRLNKQNVVCCKLERIQL